jgi:hypothetical protein
LCKNIVPAKIRTIDTICLKELYQECRVMGRERRKESPKSFFGKEYNRSERRCGKRHPYSFTVPYPPKGGKIGGRV